MEIMGISSMRDTQIRRPLIAGRSAIPSHGSDDGGGSKHPRVAVGTDLCPAVDDWTDDDDDHVIHTRMHDWLVAEVNRMAVSTRAEY